MHCNAFVMLYLKDGPLRRSSECIGMRNAVPKRQSLKEFQLFLCQMYALILYFTGNIKHQGGEGGGNEG